jgi:addiction module HigA family antidote
MTEEDKITLQIQPVRDLVEKGEFSQQDLADRIQTSRVAVNQVLNGRRSITPLMALKLEAAVGLPARELLEAQLIRDLDRTYAKNKDILESIRSNPIFTGNREVRQESASE